ncbi:MAG: hypothetical protein ACYDH9_08750 [Limisphaerales bacterium]
MNHSWNLTRGIKGTSWALIAWMAATVLLPRPSPAAETNNIPGSNTPPANSLEAFKLITQRNIFDPNRRAGQSSASGSTRIDPAVLAKAEGFSLYGVGIDGDVPTAFFDGTESKYHRMLQASNTIADYQIVKIAFDHVELQAGTNQLKLPIGMQMKKVPGGDWQLIAGSVTSASDAKSESSSNGPSSTDSAADAILKRLMQQREQELKK